MTFKIKHSPIPIFLVFLILCITNTSMGQNLTVKIQNKTGYKIDSLIIGTRFIGTVEIDSIIGPIHFTQFHFDSGIPYESIYARVGEKQLKNEWWSWCGTSHSVKEKGEFFFELVIRQNGDIDYLLLQ